VRRRALIFAGPRAVEVVEEDCPAPGPGEVQVRSRLSAVSAGTELLAYQGQLPAGMSLDETLPALTEATTQFPLRYGYASMGEVVDVGAEVDPTWRGRRVFAFVPHASHFCARANDVFVVPADVPDALAPLLASAETAVNLVLDGQPLLDERALVVGQGSVGLLVTAQLARFPLAALVALEPRPGRRALAQSLGARAVADLAAARSAIGAAGADVSFEVSGNPAALDAAIGLTGREGRVVIGSFYGQKRAPVDLGGHFHRGRLRLVSSQVSHIGPALAARWDRQRRMQSAWRLLAGVAGASESLITHRLPFTEAPAGYRLLAEGNEDVIQMLFVHT
jgi:2-desacetyl-2-hydroxyethyl bacteriochlorophyllide A dehydrogenase